MNRLVVSLLATAAMALASPAPAAADTGYEGAAVSGTSTPTGTKRGPSMLWSHDGRWWAHMWSTSAGDFHIFRLDEITQRWVDTGVTTETRSNTHADVLWDGSHLYVASYRFSSDGAAAVSGYPAYLSRYTYDPVGRTWVLDPGFPAQINNLQTESLVIDKDSTGKLWATWQANNKIYVNRTLGLDSTWGTPFVVPVNASSVTVDDTSSIVSFNGDRIGVMWSNQTSAQDGMWFAVHRDGQPDDVWEASRTALQGSGTADDHINLKSVQADSQGRVYAATKTSFTSTPQPLIMLLVRDLATGDWSSHPIARVSDCPNRPIVVLDEVAGAIHTYATYPAPPAYTCSSSGGAIYEKTSPLSSIVFGEGRGTAVMLDADSPYLHNVTSTKQSVGQIGSIALLAYNASTGRYWHSFQPLAPPPPPPSEPPVAGFEAAPTSGVAPLAVQFTDASTGAPASWSWDFGDGSTSTAQHPSHTYANAGTYTVTLTATNAYGSSQMTRTNLITVTPPPPSFTLAASPSTSTIGQGQRTSYTVTATPENGFSGLVDLSVSGVPAGATATVSPNPLGLISPSSASATLTVQTALNIKQGTYTLTIAGTGGSPQVTASTKVVLQVKRK